MRKDTEDIYIFIYVVVLLLLG